MALLKIAEGRLANSSPVSPNQHETVFSIFHK